MAYIKQNSEGIITVVCNSYEPIIGSPEILATEDCIVNNPGVFSVVDEDLPEVFQKLNYTGA